MLSTCNRVTLHKHKCCVEIILFLFEMIRLRCVLLLLLCIHIYIICMFYAPHCVRVLWKRANSTLIFKTNNKKEKWKWKHGIVTKFGQILLFFFCCCRVVGPGISHFVSGYMMLNIMNIADVCLVAVCSMVSLR